MRVSSFIVLALSIPFSGCGNSDGPPAGSKISGEIVSLDFCADQYVLELVEPSRIKALSPDASAAFSYKRDTAHGIPTVRPSAEDVLALEPDLIVRSYGGGPRAGEFFEAAGIDVVQIGWANDVYGIERVLLEVGQALGADERAQSLAADMRARLSALRERPDAERALYLTPGGVTTGPGSLIDETMRVAGLTNYQDEPGWRSLPLERMVQDPPDRLITASFANSPGDRWSAARHSLVKDMMSNLPQTELDSAWVSCGGWFVLDAIEAMNRGAGLP